jgi:tetratricopeptide (TPR) repeat protein
MFWYVHGHLSEGQSRLTALLAQNPQSSLSARAHGWEALGCLLCCRGDFEAARDALEQAQALAQEAGDTRRMAFVLHALGDAWLGLGDHARAYQLNAESLRLHRQVGEKWGESVALASLGAICMEQEDLAAARAF